MYYSYSGICVLNIFILGLQTNMYFQVKPLFTMTCSPTYIDNFIFTFFTFLTNKVLINFNSLDGDYDGFISDISLQERIKNNIPVYVVTIRFDTDKVNVKTGFGVDVKITKKNYKHALYVPQTALFTDSSGNKNNVFVKDFMSEKVKKVKIEIVDIVGVDVIVKKGLNPGDIVVTNPEKYLRHR